MREPRLFIRQKWNVMEETNLKGPKKRSKEDDEWFEASFEGLIHRALDSK